MKDGAIGLKRTIAPVSTDSETGPLFTGTLPKTTRRVILKTLMALLCARWKLGS